MTHLRVQAFEVPVSQSMWFPESSEFYPWGLGETIDVSGKSVRSGG